MRPAPPRTVFVIHNASDGTLSFHSRGSLPVDRRTVRGWPVDFGSLNVQMNDLGRYLATCHHYEDEAGRALWQNTVQQIGQHLYHGLLNTDPTLAGHLLRLRHTIYRPDHLAFEFAGPRSFLSVPYELLHDGRMPLAVQYPLYRQMTGSYGAPRPTLHALIDSLKRTGGALRVLLVAGEPFDSGPGREIGALQRTIRGKTARAGVPAQIEIVGAGRGAVERLKEKLLTGHYAIIHYAGQVHPETGGLAFAAGAGYDLLPFFDLSALVRASEARLVYLSACVGPQMWGDFALHEPDYLGPIASLVQAGTPYVLAFRWYIPADRRLAFARSFYEHLLGGTCAPEWAALHARRSTVRRDPQDETWASSILVAQTMEPTGSDL